MADGFALRPSRDEDVPEVAAIYAHHVRHGLASFEEVPPDAGEIARRRADVVGRGLPYLVAEAAGRVLGYAYAAPFRTRSAYRYSLEDSIYIAPDATGRGIGQALLNELLARSAALGYRQMVAVIGDSGNAASIALHARLGFRQVGLLQAVGYKHGRWVDSVLMQRDLGPGAATLP
jgi:phosphinothricin acetyltransferase